MPVRRRRMPVVPRKSAGELELMREAGRIVAQVLAAIEAATAPGVSMAELDRLAESLIIEAGGKPSFKGYRGYPATVCVEPDDIVVHGIPSANWRIEEGQLLGIDVGVEYRGYHADAAATFAVGAISAEKAALLRATREALEAGIAQAQAGRRLREVSSAIQSHVEACGYSVVRDLVGHGIGRSMHEPPQVPNFVEPGMFPEYELVLRTGMTLAVEPMVNMGVARVVQDDDAWTIRTADGLPSAHFEHTVAVGRDGPQILTLP